MLALLLALVTPALAAEPAPEVTFRGSGWGHGVGMSQYGAQAMALAGHSAGQVLRHYYRGVDVVDRGDDSETISVDLFAGKPVDARFVRLRADSRSGDPPSSPVVLTLGGQSRDLPHDQIWTARREGDDLVVRDGGGGEILRGRGEATVTPLPNGANPGLLRLPQLATTDRLAGTYQWGTLVLRPAGADALQPLLVMQLHHYLRGIAEMPSGWAPAALQAQAIAARTYALRQRGVFGTTAKWQVYAGWAKEGGYLGGNWVAAVDATRGLVATYRGDLAETVYSSSHGGRSENSQDSFAFSREFDYLRSVEDPWSLSPVARNPFAYWSERRANAAVADLVGLETITQVRVLSRTAGGSPQALEVSGWNDAGERVTKEWSGSKGAGAALRTPLGLRSQQISVIGLAPFADDDGSFHEYNAAAIAERGISRGCDAQDASRFCPENPVTRAQMASFLARTLDLELDAPSAGFNDVGDSTHAAAIDAIAERGITGGCDAEGTSFCPDDAVTRGQMASFLDRALDLADGDASVFDDVAGNIHAPAIGAVAEAGISNGCTHDRFCPGDPVKRGQMASFLARALGFGW